MARFQIILMAVFLLSVICLNVHRAQLLYLYMVLNHTQAKSFRKLMESSHARRSMCIFVRHQTRRSSEKVG